MEATRETSCSLQPDPRRPTLDPGQMNTRCAGRAGLAPAPRPGVLAAAGARVLTWGTRSQHGAAQRVKLTGEAGAGHEGGGSTADPLPRAGVQAQLQNRKLSAREPACGNAHRSRPSSGQEAVQPAGPWGLEGQGLQDLCTPAPCPGPGPTSCGHGPPRAGSGATCCPSAAVRPVFLLCGGRIPPAPCPQDPVVEPGARTRPYQSQPWL